MAASSAGFVPGAGPSLGNDAFSGSYVGDGAASRTITPPANPNPHPPEAIMVSNTAGAFALKIGTMPGDQSSFGNGLTLNSDGSFTLSGAVAAGLNVLGVTYYYVSWH